MVECLIQDEESVVFLVITSIALTVLVIMGLVKLFQGYHRQLRRESSRYDRFWSKSGVVAERTLQYGIGYPVILVLGLAALAACLLVVYKYGLGLYNIVKCLWES